MTVMNPFGVSRLSTWEVGFGVGLKGVSLEVVHPGGVREGSSDPYHTVDYDPFSISQLVFTQLTLGARRCGAR